MKAIRVHEFGAPEVMRYEDATMPRAGAGEVVVQIAAAGVNPVETYIRAGAYARQPPLPYTPGTDASGVVTEVGANVTRVKSGERVFTSNSLSGTYAEFALCREDDVHLLPDTIGEAEGACLGVPYATAYVALMLRAEAKPDDVVLVHGATGGVGIAAVQLAHRGGMKVIGTGGSVEGRALAFAQGADFVLDHTEENYLARVSEITGGQGVDVILEMAAHINLGNDLSILAARGQVVVIGNRGNIEINPRELMSRDARLLGMSLMNATADELSVAYARIVEGLKDKTLRPVVGREMSLADAADAHHQILEPARYGKIVLLP